MSLALLTSYLFGVKVSFKRDFNTIVMNFASPTVRYDGIKTFPLKLFKNRLSA